MIAGITRVTIKIANTFGGMLNVPTRQASLNSTLWGTLTPKNVNVMANLLKNVQRAAGNTARIITATNNKESSLRATSEDKGSANSYKEIFELFAALTHKKNRIGRSLIVQSCAERAMTIKAKIITATNNKKSSLRATSEDKGSANSYKEIFELFAALTHKKNRIGRSLIVQSCAERAMTIKAKIITATNNKESSYGLTIGSRLNQLAEITRSSRVMTGYIMNVTFNGGYNA